MKPEERAQARFVDQLKQLHEQAGHPTLVELQEQKPAWLARSTVSKLLNGKFDRPPSWERISAFVSACVEIGKSKHLRMLPEEVLLEEWRHRHAALAAALDQASRRDPRSSSSVGVSGSISLRTSYSPEDSWQSASAFATEVITSAVTSRWSLP